jgi:hypothetical protein
MQLRKTALGLITGAAFLAPLASLAGTVTELVTFSANSFQFSPPGGSVPTDPVTGSFLITFNPASTYADSTSGITLESLNISLGSALSFNYSPTAQTVDGASDAAGELVVGGIATGAGSVQYSPATNDFWLTIDNFATAPTFDSVGYSQVSAGNYIFYTPSSSDGSVSVQPVPLPASAWLLLAGLVGLGAMVPRRRAT